MYKFSLNFMISVMKFLAKSDSFQDFLFESDIVNKTSTFSWWKTHFNVKDYAFNKEVERAKSQISTVIASSNAVERVFSTFGLVQPERDSLFFFFLYR